MIDSRKLTPEQKVQIARKLLIQATIERRKERRAEEAAQLCQCGHRRDQHTISASVNYTGGFCMLED